jgi:lipopolysaccharide transport system permease protein
MKPQQVLISYLPQFKPASVLMTSIRNASVSPSLGVQSNILTYLWKTLQYYPIIFVMGNYFIKITYQRTLLGPFWLWASTLLPLFGMMVVFQQVDSFKTGEYPYPLFLISGWAVWTIVDVGIKRGMRNLNRVRKFKRVVHFPGLAVTMAGLFLPLLYHFAFLVFTILVSIIIWWTKGVFFISLDFNLLLAGLSVVLTLMLVLGISAITSVLFLIARDVRHVVSPLISFWLFVTPVVYPLEVLPEAWRTVYQYVNPMVSIVQLYRIGLFGIGSLDPGALLVAASIVLCSFLLGVWFMMRSDLVIDEILNR